MSDMDHFITAGPGGLPKVVLVASDGARSEIFLHGAHVTSWIPAGGSERLFLSTRSAFRADAAIRGGVPVIFPQFANVGPLPKHGFARTAEWELVAVSTHATLGASATLQLSHSPASLAIWPAQFVADLTVTVSEATLGVALTVRNVGTEQMTFTAALHTYLGVADVRETLVRGLSPDDIAIVGEIDQIFLNVPHPIDVVEPTRSTQVAMTGFNDVVVWNPGAKGAAALADMEPDGYVRMLCVEAAAIGRPVVVAPGATWSATQRLTAR
jgi:glucose-6-phosphate 1-epimerase